MCRRLKPAQETIISLPRTPLHFVLHYHVDRPASGTRLKRSADSPPGVSLILGCARMHLLSTLRARCSVAQLANLLPGSRSESRLQPVAVESHLAETEARSWRVVAVFGNILSLFAQD